MDHLTPELSVVIPAHNEAPTIAEVVRSCLDSAPDTCEVIVVDDGSSDETAARAAAAGAKVVRLATNAGKGTAMQAGVAHARGDVLLFIDGDGQDDPAEIRLLLSAFEPGVDLVLGSRFLGQFRAGAITPLNYLGTKFITTSVNLLFGTRVTDPLAGFRAIRRSALERVGIEARGYDVEVDMLIAVLANGGRVVEVPATRSAREFGTSGLSSLRDGTRILARIVRMRLRGRQAQRRGAAPSPTLAESPVAFTADDAHPSPATSADT